MGVDILVSSHLALRLHGVEFPVRRAGDGDSQAGHVVGDVKGLLRLRFLHRAIAGRLGIRLGRRLYVTAVLGAVAGEFLQFPVDWIVGFCGSVLLVAGGQNGHCEDESYSKNSCSHKEIVRQIKHWMLRARYLLFFGVVVCISF